MSSSDFSEIALKRESGRSERLFRAAVTAFASLVRPSRKEIAQLEDLTRPLYDSVSVDGRRFVAAVLSELELVPTELVGRLAEETVDIAAPLLLRSRSFTDVDLIALIGRHGLPHARVIARRENLNPVIAQLVTALARSEDSRKSAVADCPPAPERPMKEARSAVPNDTQPDRRSSGATVEDVRVQLRAMMRPGDPERRTGSLAASRADAPRNPYARLLDGALTGVGSFFQTALADALDIGFAQARSIAVGPDLSDFQAALKFLNLSEEQAFVIAAALHPNQFGHPETVRLFLQRYRLLRHEAAAGRIRGWKEAMLAAALQKEPSRQAAAQPLPAPANSPGGPAAFDAVRRA